MAWNPEIFNVGTISLVLQNEKGSSVRGNLACVNIVSNVFALVTPFFYGHLSLCTLHWPH